MTAKLSRRTLLAVVTLLPVVAGSGSGTAEKPRIDALTVRVVQPRALVSYRIAGGLPEQTLERIHSGLPVTFKHHMQVFAVRRFRLIPDKELARTTIKTTAEYDSLTRQYKLTRRVEYWTRHRKDAPPPEESQRTTESLDELQAWMTEFEDVPVYDPTRQLPDAPLVVKVESIVGQRFALLIFPTVVGVTAEARIDP